MDKELEKGSAVFFSISILTSIINGCFQIFTGRFLSIEDFGILNFFLSLSMVLVVPASALRMLLSRDISQYMAVGEKDKVTILFKQILLYISKFAIWFVIISTAYIVLLSQLDKYARLMTIFIAMILTAASYYNNIIIGLAQGLQKYFIMSFIGIILAVFKMLGVTIIIVLDSSTKLNAVFSFVLIGTIVATIWGYSCIQKNNEEVSIGKLRIKNKVVRVFSFNYIASALAANICIMLMTNADILLIKLIDSEYTAGLYSSSMLFNRIIIYAINAISLVLFPIVAKRDSKGNNTINVYIKSLLYCVGITMIMALVMIFLKRNIVLLLFGNEYLPSLSYTGYSYLIAVSVSLCTLNMNYLLALSKASIFVLTCILSYISSTLIILIFISDVYSLLVLLIITFFVIFLVTLISILWICPKRRTSRNE